MHQLDFFINDLYLSALKKFSPIEYVPGEPVPPVRRHKGLLAHQLMNSFTNHSCFWEWYFNENPDEWVDGFNSVCAPGEWSKLISQNSLVIEVCRVWAAPTKKNGGFCAIAQ